MGNLTKLKPIYLLITLAISIITISLFTATRAEAQGARVSFQTFYDELEPYGRWFNDPRYGYVWAPDAGPDFQPYATEGHWVVTEYGNTWVSDYPWGWAPFHYGRWNYDDNYGWFWVPDYEWGPAWVEWRSADDYYGWAPLSPGFNSSFLPVYRWIFVPQRYIISTRIYRYCIPRTRVVYVYKRSRMIDNYYERNNRRYVCGPRTYDIERITRNRVTVHRINDMGRPGRTVVQKGSIGIYRPEVYRDDDRRSRPARVIDYASRDRDSRSDDRRPEVRRNADFDRNGTERNNPVKSPSSRPERPSRGGDNVSYEGRPVEARRPVEAQRPENTTRDKGQQVERERPQRPERVMERPSGERQQASPTRQERPQSQPQRQASPERSSSGGGRPKRI
jgi:hypothetical protein